VSPGEAEALVGSVYGPVRYRTDAEKVDEIVAAVGDDPGRWSAAVPPSASGALLFAVAPLFLADPRVGEGAVIHGEQAFTWDGPIPRDAALSVTGRVARARARGGVTYVTFDVEVKQEAGRVLTGSSLFLVGGVPAGGAPEEPEPPAGEGGRRVPLELAGDGTVRAGVRGASREDLVRYAGASRDWNPIHWDHAAARAAGLPGVVVHGLLQSGWLLAEAASLRGGGRPVAGARFRFRNPLRPAAAARIEGTVDAAAAELALVGPGGPTVTASLTLGG